MLDTPLFSFLLPIRPSIHPFSHPPHIIHSPPGMRIFEECNKYRNNGRGEAGMEGRRAKGRTDATNEGRKGENRRVGGGFPTQRDKLLNSTRPSCDPCALHPFLLHTFMPPSPRSFLPPPPCYYAPQKFKNPKIQKIEFLNSEFLEFLIFGFLFFMRAVVRQWRWVECRMGGKFGWETDGRPKGERRERRTNGGI